MKLELDVIGEVFRFTSFDDWADHAKARFVAHGLAGSPDFICVDAVGRVCTCGKEFSRAQREGTYPVVVYRVVAP